MTIYLTKIEDGKTHHFKATVHDKVVQIVHGIFYSWLSKYTEGCDNNASAIARQKKLINEKLNEGFQITEFEEIPENTIEVYDKAKWHISGNFPSDLDNFQGYVHTGLFLGWLIDTNLVSDEFKDDHAEAIEEFKQHKLKGPEIFESCCDGVLTIEDINESGNHFSLSYFNFDTGQYLSDYEETLGKALPSLYHVRDTWDNYLKLKQVLDKRFADWNSKNN